MRAYNGDNPNMQIYESYLIRSSSQKEAIVDIMIRYDLDNPSQIAWNRTKDSLLSEWEIHNFAADFGYGRALSTDFDRNEENYSVWDYVGKLFR